MSSSPPVSLPSGSGTVRSATCLLLAASLLFAGGLAATAGDVGADETPDETGGIAHVIVEDVTIGADAQTIGPIRAAKYGDADRVAIEIDLTPLERRGVVLDGAEVDLEDDGVHDATVAAASVEDGALRIVVEPEAGGFAVDAFAVTGLDTTAAEGAADVEYDVEFSHGDGRIAGAFDLIDPDDVTPTVEPKPLYFDHGNQMVHVRDVQPAGETVTVEVDLRTLADIDVDVGDLAADATAEGGTVRTTTVRDGVVTAVVEPDDAVPTFDVAVEIEWFDAGGIDEEAVVLAEDVAYEASVDGDADDTVEVERFDVVLETPTPHDHDDAPRDDPAGKDGEEPGAGSDDEESAPDSATLNPAAAAVAILLAARLFAGRRN